jgi:hypothetical protein
MERCTLYAVVNGITSIRTFPSDPKLGQGEEGKFFLNGEIIPKANVEQLDSEDDQLPS